MSQRQRRRPDDSTRTLTAGSGIFLEGPAAAVPPAAVHSDPAAVSSPTTESARQWRLLRAGLLLDELGRVQQLREMSASEQQGRGGGRGGSAIDPAEWRRLQLEEEWRRGQWQSQRRAEEADSLQCVAELALRTRTRIATVRAGKSRDWALTLIL